MNELEADKGDDEMRESEGVLKNLIGPREDDEEKLPHHRTRQPPTQMEKSENGGEPRRRKAMELRLRTTR